MYYKLTRTSLLLALMIVFQCIRLFVPVPPFISMFVIGSAVNACLLVAVEVVGWKYSLVLAIVAPIIAYLQQVFPLPILIIPIAAANLCYVLSYNYLVKYNRWLAVGLSAVFKMVGLYLSVSWIFKFVNLPEKIATIFKMMVSWPQLITGVAGGILCLIIVKRLDSIEMKNR